LQARLTHVCKANNSIITQKHLLTKIRLHIYYSFICKDSTTARKLDTSSHDKEIQSPPLKKQLVH